jgi:NADP-dependent 3-hydroxy acid dehydrogenase YdfG
MKSTIVVCGHGPGISNAVARRFGTAGHKVALVARTADKLTAAAAELQKVGIEAKAFATDLGDESRVRAMIADVQKQLGSIGIVHWNAYGRGAGDLIGASSSELRGVLDVGVHSLLAAVNAAHADLVANKGAVLITGGGLSSYNAAVDRMAVSWGAMGLAVSKAAQHKLTGLLHERLEADGIYAGEVTVMGIVKGTAFDKGNGTLDPGAIAEQFWTLYTERTATFADAR